jgi:signal recognition particle GTPase
VLFKVVNNGFLSEYLPIRYIGVGEGINDLKPFITKNFIDAIFD